MHGSLCVLLAVRRVKGTHCMFEMKEGTASSPSNACSSSSCCSCWFVFCLNLVIVFGFSSSKQVKISRKYKKQPENNENLIEEQKMGKKFEINKRTILVLGTFIIADRESKLGYWTTLHGVDY